MNVVPGRTAEFIALQTTATRSATFLRRHNQHNIQPLHFTTTMADPSRSKQSSIYSPASHRRPRSEQRAAATQDALRRANQALQHLIPPPVNASVTSSSSSIEAALQSSASTLASVDDSPSSGSDPLTSPVSGSTTTGQILEEACRIAEEVDGIIRSHYSDPNGGGGGGGGAPPPPPALQ